MVSFRLLGLVDVGKLPKGDSILSKRGQAQIVPSLRPSHTENLPNDEVILFVQQFFLPLDIVDIHSVLAFCCFFHYGG